MNNKKKKSNIFIIISILVIGIIVSCLCLGIFSRDTNNEKPTPTKSITSTIVLTLKQSIYPTNTPQIFMLKESSTPIPTHTQVPKIEITHPITFDCHQKYDCKDFSSYSEANEKYNFCGANNWNNLDRDRDGNACESLR